MDPAQGRSRARARGRARGQQPPEPARRPTDVPVTTPLAQFPPVMQAAAQPPQPAGTGRAIHRGGASIETRPGEASALAANLDQMRIGAGDQAMGRGAIRGRRIAMEEIHSRPLTCSDKKGTSGTPIELLSNYVKVESLKGQDFIFYQYRVEFSPTVESSKMRRAMLFDHLDKLGRSFTFDGMEDLKTTNRLEQDQMEMYSKRRTDDENIRITVKLTGELNGKHPEVLRLMNTQQRKNFVHMGFIQMGRHFFDKVASIAIQQYKLELWPGVVTAIRLHENSLLMVVDNIHKVLRLDTVLDQIREHYSRDRINYIQNCIKELAGSIVMTKYNNRTYSLDDFDSSKCPKDTFDNKKTGPTTYMEYYKKQYDIDIRDDKQPLIVCRPKERDIRGGNRDPVYLIPELCVMTGLTEHMKSDFNLMKEVAKTTRPGPRSRVEHVNAFVNRCITNDKVKDDMAKWGIKYSSEPIKIRGRIMPAEKIIQGPTQFMTQNGDFSREMRSKPMHNPAHIDRIVMISTQRDRVNCEELYDTFRKVCGPMKMKTGTPKIVSLSDDRITSFLNAIRDNIKTGNFTLVVVVVPNNRKDRYDAIKKLCCVDCPVPSQVVVSRTLSKKQMLMSVATKIAIQINCKLGGEAWTVEIPLKQKTMIVGIDSYHDSFQKGRSVGAIVASMNNVYTSWHSRIAFHHQREEMLDQLRVNFSILLKKYHAINKDLPDIILIYRDGVSDGQIGYVKEHEVTQLLAAYNDLSKGVKSPRFAFVVVNKRISTRFFTNGQGNYDNPPPGTVIDTEVTQPERYDFYLVSQSVRQGTVSPTLFNIIEDTTGLKPDHIQRITYKLTHMYYNWQGTIRVPAPCQYAHKLAFLVGQSLHSEPAEALADKLYFL